MPNLIKKIQNTNHQEKLWERNSQIVLGVSGGPDSVCMLDIFSALQKKYNLDLIIAHVNYGLRGKDSRADEKFVRKLADKYGLKIFVLNSKSQKKDENALRNIRYAFFEKIRKTRAFDSIAVAHNSDDQVETFLMRLIRGSGLTGLSAMRFKKNSIIRPFLGTTRQEILQYLQNKKIAYRIDRTNLTNVFFRNKIRNQLIPYLEKFNPNIRKTILASTISIAEDNNYLSETTKKICKGEIGVKKLLGLHPALQKRILLSQIADNNPELRDIESAHIKEIIKALKSTKNKPQIVVFKGLKMIRRGDTFNIKSV